MSRIIVVLGVLACTTLAACRATGGPANGAEESPWTTVAWLAGTWTGENDDVGTEEHWTEPRGGSMLGVNRTIADDRLAFFEFLRIDRDDLGFVYLAAPRGRFPPIPFRLQTADEGRLVFENPAHDFPQRIIYERQGERGLLQRIEGREDGAEKSSTWKLRRVR